MTKFRKIYLALENEGSIGVLQSQNNFNVTNTQYIL